MLKLDYCNCTVRLAGNLLHEVNKENISNLELKILRRIHGADSVVNVKRTHSLEVDEQTEYYRLARIYNPKVVGETLRVDLDNYAEWLEREREREDAERNAAQQKRQEEFVRNQRERTAAALQEANKADAMPAPAKPAAPAAEAPAAADAVVEPAEA